MPFHEAHEHVSTPSTRARKLRQAREYMSTPARKARKASKARGHDSSPFRRLVEGLCNLEFGFGFISHESHLPSLLHVSKLGSLQKRKKRACNRKKHLNLKVLNQILVRIQIPQILPELDFQVFFSASF